MSGRPTGPPVFFSGVLDDRPPVLGRGPGSRQPGRPTGDGPPVRVVGRQSGRAQANADARAAEALDAVLAAGATRRRGSRRSRTTGPPACRSARRSSAGYGDTIITRNSYGARCLNSPNALFADVDFSPGPRFRWVPDARGPGGAGGGDRLVGARPPCWASSWRFVALVAALPIAALNGPTRNGEGAPGRDRPEPASPGSSRATRTGGAARLPDAGRPAALGHAPAVRPERPGGAGVLRRHRGRPECTSGCVSTSSASAPGEPQAVADRHRPAHEASAGSLAGSTRVVTGSSGVVRGLRGGGRSASRLASSSRRSAVGWFTREIAAVVRLHDDLSRATSGLPIA